MILHLRHFHFFRYLYDILLFEFDTWFLVRHLLHTHTIQYFVLPSSFNPLSYNHYQQLQVEIPGMDSIERDFYELSNMMAMLIATYVFWCQQIAWLLNKSTRIVSTKPHRSNTRHRVSPRFENLIRSLSPMMNAQKNVALLKFAGLCAPLLQKYYQQPATSFTYCESSYHHHHCFQTCNDNKVGRTFIERHRHWWEKRSLVWVVSYDVVPLLLPHPRPRNRRRLPRGRRNGNKNKTTKWWRRWFRSKHGCIFGACCLCSLGVRWSYRATPRTKDRTSRLIFVPTEILPPRPENVCAIGNTRYV